MLLRHAVQYRRIGFWRGLPTTRRLLSNSTKATNSEESVRGPKKGNKKNKTAKAVHSSSNVYEKTRNQPASGQNFWNMLGRDVDESELLPQARDTSWKNSNNNNKEKGDPKNAQEVHTHPNSPPKLFPCVQHPVHSPTPPTPTTTEELTSNLVAMRNAVPVIALAQTVRYHDCYPWLQSSRSFNTVLELAVRHSAIGTARKLLHAMDARKIPFTGRTAVLVTRLKVRVGHRMLLRLRRRWFPQSTLGAHNRPVSVTQVSPGERIGRLFGDAVEMELTQLRRDASLDVLAEYLGTPHRVSAKDYRTAYLGTYRRDVKKVFRFEILLRRESAGRRRKQRTPPVFLPKLTLGSVPPQPSSPLSAYDIISMDYNTLVSRPTKDFTPYTPPLSATLMSRLVAKIHPGQRPDTIHRVSLLLVRRLLLEGKREVAIRFATAHVQQLCAGQASLSPAIMERVLHIIHLFLHDKYGCPTYTEGRNTLTMFLRIHPDLKPRPETLSILLQNLRKANRRSMRAYDALKWFRKRWPDVEDEGVRRTVAKFALQDKSGTGDAIAKEMAQREADLGTRWRLPRAQHQDLSQPQARAFGSIYTREHRDKQEWIRMGLITRRKGFELASKLPNKRRGKSEKASDDDGEAE